MLYLRGIADVTEDFMVYDKMISGISGIGHILLGVGIILFFLILKNQTKLTVLNSHNYAPEI